MPLPQLVSFTQHELYLLMRINYLPLLGRILQILNTAALKPVNKSLRSSEELLHISWIYPLRGIPVEAPFESSPHAVLQCEVGGQLEHTVDVQLTGYVPGNQELRGQQGEFT